MDVVRRTIMAVAAGVAFGIPLAAVADPPAATPPQPPPVFVGAPTTQQGGEFTLNFNGLGEFQGVGRPDEHNGPFELAPGQERRQARNAARERPTAASENVFLGFLRQLRTVDNQRTDDTQRPDRR